MLQPIPGQPHPRGDRATCERPTDRIIARRIFGASAWLLAAMLAARPALADELDGQSRHPAGDGSHASVARAGHARTARPSGPSWLRGEPGGTAWDNGWSGMACVALALIGCGGLAVWARRLAPRATAGVVQVVGRVSLSPKHSVYLLRVGRRVLVLGAGPQGPPALITELDEVSQDPPAAQQGTES
jgi:hypothetical protein